MKSLPLLKLSRPTVFRILRTLEKLNYVVFDGALETYRIARRLKDLGQSHLSEVIGKLGRPAMMRLLAEFEQTVNLAIFENDKLISTVMPKEDLGLGNFKHNHNAVLRRVGSKYYIIVQAWNPGDFAILEQAND